MEHFLGEKKNHLEAPFTGVIFTKELPEEREMGGRLEGRRKAFWYSLLCAKLEWSKVDLVLLCFIFSQWVWAVIINHWKRPGIIPLCPEVSVLYGWGDRWPLPEVHCQSKSSQPWLNKIDIFTVIWLLLVVCLDFVLFSSPRQCWHSSDVQQKRWCTRALRHLPVSHHQHQHAGLPPHRPVDRWPPAQRESTLFFACTFLPGMVTNIFIFHPAKINRDLYYFLQLHNAFFFFFARYHLLLCPATFSLYPEYQSSSD